MNRLILAVSAGAVALVPAAALASHRPGHQGGGGGNVTVSQLDARPNPVVFGAATTLSGRLANQRRTTEVRLEIDDTRPFGDSFRQTDQRTTTTNAGRFSFSVRPQRNAWYRAVARPQGQAPVTGAPRRVSVRTRVGLIVSDRTPRRGQRIRVSGTVRPPKDGREALIQRRSSTGRFVTVRRATLSDAGDVYSRYVRRFRVRRDGVYRVKVPGDQEHVNGFSRRVTIDVGG